MIILKVNPGADNRMEKDGIVLSSIKKILEMCGWYFKKKYFLCALEKI